MGDAADKRGAQLDFLGYRYAADKSCWWDANKDGDPIKNRNHKFVKIWEPQSDFQCYMNARHQILLVKNGNGEALIFYNLTKMTMEITVKEGNVIEHEGRHWIITQIGEDNEGQTVIHIRSGDEVSVIKVSDMPYDLKLVR